MASHIYHGAWINWNRGGVILGATLTTSEQSGGLLISFIATFVTLVGVQLWKILAFALHQIRSTAKPKDGLFHQQQAIWRNSAGPGGTAWSFLQQAWFWRTKAKQSFLRTFFWAVFATAYLVLFAVLAVFSSQISKSPGPQRLLIADSNTCGYWIIDKSSPNQWRTFASRQSNVSQAALTYARSCYGGGNNPLACSRFPQPSLNWTSNLNATCPFQSGICGYGDTAAFEMTSELIDSNLDLGINTKPSDSVQVQLRTTCAPIRNAKYEVQENITRTSDEGVNYTEPWWTLYFGPFVNATGVVVNSTETVAEHGFTCSLGYQVSSVIHRVNTLTATSNVTTNGWSPVPAVYRADADTVLVFLKPNAMRYYYPTFDPMFYANITNTEETSGTLGGFLADNWITTLGCAEQYRFCNPSNGLCTDYAGALTSVAAIVNRTQKALKVGFTNEQLNVVTRFETPLIQTSIYDMTYYQGSSALRAQETVSNLDQTAELPVSQWRTEASGWFDAGLSALQAMILEYATGPPYIEDGSLLYQPSAALCHSQIINDAAGTTSFSILGLAVLFIIGGIIIFTSLIIDRVVGLLQYWFKFNLQGQRAWMLDDKLQMQKTVFENAGMGRWKSGDLDAIPVTIVKDEFSRFPADQLLGPNTPDTPYTPYNNQTYFQESGPNQNDGPFSAPHYSTEMEYMDPFHDDRKIPSTYSRSRQSSSSYLKSVT